MRTLEDYIEAELICRITRHPNESLGKFAPENTTLAVIDSYTTINVKPEELKRLLQRLISMELLDIVRDVAAGDFYRISRDRVVATFQQEAAIPDSLVSKYEILGSQLVERASENLRSGQEAPEKPLLESPGLVAPASDRIVTLQHNQQGEIDGQFNEVIDAVEQLNGIEGEGNVRQQVLGELRAGRELIRAQTFRAYLLYNTVISSLGSLIEKYKDHAIGAAATRLVELLIEHIFGVK